MMRCRDIERWATEYVDGELDDRRASAVRGHLRTCPSCLARIEDEAAVRGAAESLEPALDPPASLGSGIETRLADAEVADSRRSRAWLWWQGARTHLLAGVAATAVVLFAVVWTVRRGGESDTAQRAGVAAAPEAAPEASLPERSISFAEQLSDEVTRADARYQQTIAELRAIAVDERAEWSREAARQFDARLGELDAEVQRARATAASERTPRSHDGLFAAYRSEIAFLSEQAIDGDLP